MVTCAGHCFAMQRARCNWRARYRHATQHAVHHFALIPCLANAESMLRLACKIFSCDMACCTLLTGDAYHVLAGAGILRPGICPDRWGFCAWSFLNSNHELLVVEDLKNDVR